MPFLSFDLIEGRSDAELKILLDATHEAVLEAFGVPERDRYQVVNTHKPSHFIVQDTGLGIARTDNVVVIRMITRPRSPEEKQRFYLLLTEKLHAQCGIAAHDVMVSLIVNSDEDWSFGHGRAQFLTGEL